MTCLAKCIVFDTFYTEILKSNLPVKPLILAYLPVTPGSEVTGINEVRPATILYSRFNAKNLCLHMFI